MLFREFLARYAPILLEAFDGLLMPLTGSLDNPDGLSFLLIPLFHVVTVSQAGLPLSETIIATIPFNTLSLGFLVAARQALVKNGNGQYFSFSRLHQLLFRRLRFRSKVTRKGEIQGGQSQTAPDSIQQSRDLPTVNAIAWREIKRLHTFKCWYIGAVTVLLLWYWIWANSTANGWQSVDLSAVFTLSFRFFGLLIVLSLSSRTFVIERERQTLDSLLTCPLNSREMLREKLAGIDTAIFWILVVCGLLGLIRVFSLPFEHSASIFAPGFPRNFYSRRGEVFPLSNEWLGKSLEYMVMFLGNTFIHTQNVKWVSVWFSLKARGQMKAMLGAIVTLLLISFGPFVCFNLAWLAAIDNDPDRALSCFSSPLMIDVLGQADDLHQVYQNTWFPDSDLLVILVNFLIYGGLALCLRTFVLRELNDLLERRDDH